MQTVREQVSEAVFKQMETLIDRALEQHGELGKIEHLKAAAYSLGAQLAVFTNPRHMPDNISVLMTEFGKGIQNGMLAAHEMDGQLTINVYGVNRI